MKALIVVDIQNDFCPGGSLAVKDGNKIIARVNQLIAKYKSKGDLIVYTKDAHPSNHSSFKDNGGIWPSHCVTGTAGYELNSLLLGSQGYVFEKGFEVDKDSYSGFGGFSARGTRGETGLDDYLKEQEVTEVLVVGLALDYCVKATALDASKLGFRTTVDLNGTKAVNVNPGDDKKAIQELRQFGVKVIGD